MAESTFTVVYDGPAVVDHRMDVRELAPALLSLAELFKEANYALRPDDPPVSLHIRAAGDGSFEVDLVLMQEDVVNRVIDFFTADAATALANMQTLVIGPVGAGLFWLIKRLRGRRISNVRRSTTPGTVTITLDDGATVEVPEQTLTLYRNVRVRRRAHEVVQPLRREGIETLRFKARADEITVEVPSEEVDAYDLPPDAGAEPLLEQDTEMALSIVAVAFQPGNKWRLSDGSSTFFAAMDDGDFNARVQRGDEAFRNGDILRCQLHIAQVRTDTGLSTEYSVKRVVAHIPASRPVQLDLIGDAADGPEAP